MGQFFNLRPLSEIKVFNSRTVLMKGCIPLVSFWVFVSKVTAAGSQMRDHMGKLKEGKEKNARCLKKELNMRMVFPSGILMYKSTTNSNNTQGFLRYKSRKIHTQDILTYTNINN